MPPKQGRSPLLGGAKPWRAHRLGGAIDLQVCVPLLYCLYVCVGDVRVCVSISLFNTCFRLSLADLVCVAVMERCCPFFAEINFPLCVQPVWCLSAGLDWKIGYHKKIFGTSCSMVFGSSVRRQTWHSPAMVCHDVSFYLLLKLKYQSLVL
jgi:hypothetical protein